MTTPKPLCAGNWKMNGLANSLKQIEALKTYLSSDEYKGHCDVLICPPTTLLMGFGHVTEESELKIGGQDCHINEKGAHTGDISAQMIKDTGADYVIVGHSERRMDHSELDKIVKAKALAAQGAGLTPIICVGELKGERTADLTLKVIERQLNGSLPDGFNQSDFVIAYEPVWAIGTGLVPTSNDVEQVHGFIRTYLQDRYGDKGASIRILYGGSVKPGNAHELMAIQNVNGALVGGASLKAEDFIGIISAFGDIYS